MTSIVSRTRRPARAWGRTMKPYDVVGQSQSENRHKARLWMIFVLALAVIFGRSKRYSSDENDGVSW